MRSDDPVSPEAAGRHAAAKAFRNKTHGFILCTYAVTVDKGRMWSKGRSVRNVQKKMDPQIAAGADRSDIDPQR